MLTSFAIKTAVSLVLLFKTIFDILVIVPNPNNGFWLSILLPIVYFTSDPYKSPNIGNCVIKKVNVADLYRF